MDSEDNPFSSLFVGAEEHRRRVASKFGNGRGGLKKHGAPSRGAMKRALPGQLATLLNTLRFVDAVNALLSRPRARRSGFDRFLRARGLGSDLARSGIDLRRSRAAFCSARWRT